MKTIGLLFESQTDLLTEVYASEATHYHWREPEEVDAVAQALESLGHSVERIGSMDDLLHRWRQEQLPDFVWNLSVRAVSRSRTAIAPAFLEQLQLPYSGADAACKSLVLNKDWLKPLLRQYGIQTPSWVCYGLNDEITQVPDWPVSILKPTCEGYSLGLTRFEMNQGISKLRSLVAHLQQQFQCPILCEPLIPGREITVGIVGNPGPVFPRLIGAVETLTSDQRPLGNQVLDVAAKRRGGFQKVAMDLEQPESAPLKTAALKLMQQLAPLDYATFDFRVTLEGHAYLLDVNADATLHPERSLAQVARAVGWTYQQLIQAILANSFQRWQLY